MAAKFDLVVAAKTVGAASIKRLGNSMQGVQGRVKNLRMAMSGLNKTFATLGLILSAGAFVRMVKGSIDAADAFGKLEIQTGIAANTLQAYVNAGKLAGVSQETIEKGLRRLAQSMREADQGVATYKDAFDDLGISVKNTDGTLKTNEQVLGEISDKFAQMEDGVTKSAIAMEIFGRSGSQMVNLLNEGKVALEQFNFEVSERFAQNAEYFNDQLTMLGFKATGFSRQLADGLSPTLNNLAESLYFDFKRSNVRVCLVSPGFIKTPMTDKNDFKMPFLKTTKYAAEKIYDGLINKNVFEIHFPKSLTLILKILSFLPSKIYFGLVGKMTKYQKKN